MRITLQELAKHALILYSFINLSCHTYRDATVRSTKMDTRKNEEIWIQKV